MISEPTRNFIYGLGFTICLAAVPALSKANTIFDNFDSGHSYQCCQGYGIEGAGTGQQVFSAMGFTPSGTTDLAQIDVGITWSFGTNSVDLSLNADSGGAPGAVIESWVISSLALAGSTTNSIATVLSTPGVLLLSGQQYWVVAEPGDSSTFAAWNINSVGDFGTGSQYYSGSWHTSQLARGAFDVLGATPAPEPGALILMASGLMGLLAQRRRNLSK